MFHPTAKSEAGYRLYDDKALEELQQILFFREFDIPLQEIKKIMEDPSLERNQILQMQRKMLIAKKERMERLIASIDDILKGDNKMDFTVFSKTEIERMFQLMFDSMPEKMRQTAIEEFGGKDEYLSTLENPLSKEVAESYKKREEAIREKLAAKRDCDPSSFEVKAIIGEYGFVMKQICQMKEDKGIMLAVAKSYRETPSKQTIDHLYGEGTADFFAKAIETFYQD